MSNHSVQDKRHRLYILHCRPTNCCRPYIVVTQLTQSAFLEDISLFNALRENISSVEKVLKCKSVEIKDRISKTYSTSIEFNKVVPIALATFPLCRFRDIISNWEKYTDK